MKNVVKEILKNYATEQMYEVGKEELEILVCDVMEDIDVRNTVIKGMRDNYTDDAEMQLYADFLENMITKKIETTYAPDTDMTFILEYTDKANENYDVEVIGYYHGEPNEQETNDYKYTLKHV